MIADLADAHGAERQVGGSRAIHPRLNRRRLEVADTRRPASAPSDEGQVLPEVPSVGSHPSFRFAALLALERAELLDQVDERLSHAPGPPARATATFSPGPSELMLAAQSDTVSSPRRKPNDSSRMRPMSG